MDIHTGRKCVWLEDSDYVLAFRCWEKLEPLFPFEITQPCSASAQVVGSCSSRGLENFAPQRFQRREMKWRSLPATGHPHRQTEHPVTSLQTKQWSMGRRIGQWGTQNLAGLPGSQRVCVASSVQPVWRWWACGDTPGVSAGASAAQRLHDLEGGTVHPQQLAGDARTGAVHQECWAWFWLTLYETDVDLLERVSKRLQGWWTGAWTGEAGSWNCSPWGREGAGGVSSVCTNSKVRWVKPREPALPSGAGAESTDWCTENLVLWKQSSLFY